jgi:hypothetical protein
MLRILDMNSAMLSCPGRVTGSSSRRSCVSELIEGMGMLKKEKKR